jgi:PAS domain S-box-containing protein
VETSNSTQRPGRAFSLKFFIFFAFLFLILLLFYYQSLLFSSQQQLESQKKALFIHEMEDFKFHLAGHLKEAQENPAYLPLLGEKAKLRITLFNKSSLVVSDSSGKLKRGDPLDSIPDSSELPEGFWRGEAGYRSYKKNQQEAEIYFSLLAGSGDPSAGTQASSLNALQPIGIRMIREREIPKEREAGIYLFFIKLFGAVGLFTLGVAVYRYFRQWLENESRLASGEIKDTNPVLYTFQGLIQELKAKEQELEKLKNQAENRAVQSETFQEAILRSVSSGVITFNKDKTMTSFNESAEKIFGIPRQETIGKSCLEVFGEGSKILALLTKALLENETISRAEFEISRGKSGERIWIGVSSSFLRDQQGDLLGTTFIFTDLTEVKMLQEQVELQKRLTVLGEMSAGIAHEFRNFMGTILGYVRLLGKRIEKDHPDHQMIEAVIAELKSMDHLIHELLNFGRRTPVNKAKVLLEPFFSKLISQILSQYPGILPRVTCKIADPLLAVDADEILIRQAFMNIIQNGLEAMPAGGSLAVRAGASPLEKNAMVLIEIEDTGGGIAADHLEKIFVPFFTRKEKGTGLGLAIVHKIILSHGGRIRVESEEGKGALFKIYLPAG